MTQELSPPTIPDRFSRAWGDQLSPDPSEIPHKPHYPCPNFQTKPAPAPRQPLDSPPPHTLAQHMPIGPRRRDGATRSPNPADTDQLGEAIWPRVPASPPARRHQKSSIRAFMCRCWWPLPSAWRWGISTRRWVKA